MERCRSPFPLILLIPSLLAPHHLSSSLLVGLGFMLASATRYYGAFRASRYADSMGLIEIVVIDGSFLFQISLRIHRLIKLWFADGSDLLSINYATERKRLLAYDIKLDK
ncbi:hypothetical protein OPV22_005420 [Ensete ventricosum]|uniref:Uncharacterized protein n=1 Tax=Ensete ventricosum TaxID=4639 RepID=A0AAV8RKZ8_ENSVE|nr:hypothetical protein OPV22_005420 [Ensete ventricosum]